MNEKFKSMSPFANKIINRDGTIEEFYDRGVEIYPADPLRAEKYKNMSPFANAMLNEDGSITEIGTSGGGTVELPTVGSGTTAEMNLVTGMENGDFWLNSDTNTVWKYDGTSWNDTGVGVGVDLTNYQTPKLTGSSGEAIETLTSTAGLVSALKGGAGYYGVTTSLTPNGLLGKMTVLSHNLSGVNNNGIVVTGAQGILGNTYVIALNSTGDDVVWEQLGGVDFFVQGNVTSDEDLKLLNRKPGYYIKAPSYDFLEDGTTYVGTLQVLDYGDSNYMKVLCYYGVEIYQTTFSDTVVNLWTKVGQEDLSKYQTPKLTNDNNWITVFNNDEELLLKTDLGYYGVSGDYANLITGTTNYEENYEGVCIVYPTNASYRIALVILGDGKKYSQKYLPKSDGTGTIIESWSEGVQSEFILTEPGGVTDPNTMTKGGVYEKFVTTNSPTGESQRFVIIVTEVNNQSAGRKIIQQMAYASTFEEEYKTDIYTRVYDPLEGSGWTAWCAIGDVSEKISRSVNNININTQTEVFNYIIQNNATFEINGVLTSTTSNETIIFELFKNNISQGTITYDSGSSSNSQTYQSNFFEANKGDIISVKAQGTTTISGFIKIKKV